MKIDEYISRYKNHPVLFVGAGMSLRYLNNAYNWDALLQKIALEIFETEEDYFNIKSDCMDSNDVCDYAAVGTRIEEEFNKRTKEEPLRSGKFKEINDQFFASMKLGNNVSRFKLYLVSLLKELNYKDDMLDEIKEFKKVRKNISSVITTNYDQLIEDIFEFKPLIGNEILLSNPYGTVYKIHGCVTDPKRIIINQSDYENFETKYELIRAQLLSLFIHNPIVFMGYSISDENIKNLLKTIFYYVDPNSEEARLIKNNFLLVEREKGSVSEEVVDHDIEIKTGVMIRINKLKTDNYIAVYEHLSKLTLPVSAMDIRKVQSVVRQICEGNKDDADAIKVVIANDVDSLENNDKILVIGSNKGITYTHRNAKDLSIDYFLIIEESNHQYVELIDKINVNKGQWFPAFGFYTVNPQCSKLIKLKKRQMEKIEEFSKKFDPRMSSFPRKRTVKTILESPQIAASSVEEYIAWSTLNDRLKLDDVEKYLLNYDNKIHTNYRRLLSIYDYKKYSV